MRLDEDLATVGRPIRPFGKRVRENARTRTIGAHDDDFDVAPAFTRESDLTAIR
jgi:hypothetical protein